MYPLFPSGNDGLIKVWNPDSLELKNTITGHDNEIRKLLPTAERLYSGDMNGKVRTGTGVGILEMLEVGKLTGVSVVYLCQLTSLA